jgi:hypothetical protein
VNTPPDPPAEIELPDDVPTRQALVRELLATVATLQEQVRVLKDRCTGIPVTLAGLLPAIRPGGNDRLSLRAGGSGAVRRAIAARIDNWCPPPK